MNFDNIKRELTYQAALLCFNKTDRHEVKSICNDLMIQGIYFDSFLGMDDAQLMVDFTAAFYAILKDLDVVFPDNQDDAVWIVLTYHIENIISGQSDPLEELTALIHDVYYSYDFHSKTKNFVGDSHDIEHLVGLYWSYDDMLERRDENIDTFGKELTEEDVLEIKQEVVKASQDWLELHPS